MREGEYITEPATFAELIQLVRRGDEHAAERLVRTYERQIRRVVRVRLQDRRLRHTLDSMDISQSVLASFFLRAATGQFELSTPDQLVHLLAAMTRNKLRDWERKQKAARRDRRRETSFACVDIQPTSNEKTPSEEVSAKELLQRALELLSDAERRLATRWASGEPWEDIAEEMEKSPDALRMQLRRSLDRIARQLGVEDD